MYTGGEVTTQAQQKTWEDIGFMAVAEPKESSCDFKAYRVWVHGDKLLPSKKKADSLPDFAESLEDAHVYLDGFVKWDGCSNWTFAGELCPPLHFCDKQEAVNIGELLARLYDWAAELIPNWDGPKPGEK